MNIRLPARRKIHAGVTLQRRQDGTWIMTPHPTTDLHRMNLKQRGVEELMKSLVNCDVDFIMVSAYITEKESQ